MRYRQSAFCGLFSFGKIDCAQRKNQTACSHARLVSSLGIGRLPATEMERQTETVHAEEKVTKGV